MIPTQGVHVSRSEHPDGWFVAMYDAQGFTSRRAWFPDYLAACRYATALRVKLWHKRNEEDEL